MSAEEGADVFRDWTTGSLIGRPRGRDSRLNDCVSLRGGARMVVLLARDRGDWVIRYRGQTCGMSTCGAAVR